MGRAVLERGTQHIAQRDVETIVMTLACSTFALLELASDGRKKSTKYATC